MTTFKQYLLEAETGDFSDFKNNAQLMLDKKIFLYRGTATEKTGIELASFTGHIATARTIARRPKGSKVAHKISANWEIPPRSLSYFTTRSAHHADRFGYLMLVIPADDVSQYAWTATDFNEGSSDSFKKKFQTLELAMARITRYVREMDISEGDKYEDEIFKILQKLGIMQVELDRIDTDDPKVVKLIDAMLDQYENFETLNDNKYGESSFFIRNIFPLLKNTRKLLEKMEMKSVGDVFKHATKDTFKIKTFSSLSDIPKMQALNADELWFNGKYLAINLDSQHTAEKDAVKALKLLLSKE